MELATCLGGDITLTARGQPVTLSPDQVRLGNAPALFPSSLSSINRPSFLFEHTNPFRATCLGPWQGGVPLPRSPPGFALRIPLNTHITL